jgi:enoyl-CoA hydratase/long-chain 3-hydroxyacyl-CoA dehydrogenase
MGKNVSEAIELGKSIELEVIDGVAVIRMDDPDKKVNALSESFATELQAAFDKIANDATVKAGVLISTKPDCFIAGADIEMLQACRSAAEVQKLGRGMQEQLNRLEQSDKPVVAAIHGSCLGGGLEVALACHYRICTEHKKTILGLPEVMLGLLPGGGGTQRLPRLVGLQASLDMMLTGKNIRPRKAKKMGLVDEVVEPFGLEQVAITAAKRLAEGDLKRKEREPSAQDRALEETGAGRLVVFRQARQMVMAQTKGNYPAPLAILDVVEHGLKNGFAAGLEEESRRFGELGMTKEAAALMSLFFAQTALKKNRYGKPEVNTDTLGVLGAGLMGAGIALVSVQKGMRVHLKDISWDGVAAGKKAIYKELDKRAKRKAMTSFERDRLMANVIGQLDYEGFNNCDVVIEAVFEDIKIKHRVISELEEHIHDDCVFASNTSALPITEIAKGSKRPENVVGMHYFSPVHKMPLLEVIVTDQTRKEAAALAVDVGLKQCKTVIVVKDGPGFYTTRILAPYMDEASIIGQEGIDFYEFDQMMMRFGFPVGPITLLDEVGLDVAAHVAKDMGPFFAERFGERDTSALDAMVKAGYLGRKAKAGFLLYGQDKSPAAGLKKFIKKGLGQGGGKPVNPGAMEIFRAHGADAGKGSKLDETEVQHRMAMRFVNEAVLCLEDGILENPRDGDIGAVFGLGFPPFTGGPFRYIDTEGAGKVVQIMEKLADKYGKRFAPAQTLVDMAKSGKRFHTD